MAVIVFIARFVVIYSDFLKYFITVNVIIIIITFTTTAVATITTTVIVTVVDVIVTPTLKFNHPFYFIYYLDYFFQFKFITLQC